MSAEGLKNIEMPSILWYSLDPTGLLTLGKFDRSANHDGQDRVGVLGNRGSGLLKPVCKIFFVAERS